MSPQLQAQIQAQIARTAAERAASQAPQSKPVPNASQAVPLAPQAPATVRDTKPKSTARTAKHRAANLEATRKAERERKAASREKAKGVKHE